MTPAERDKQRYCNGFAPKESKIKKQIRKDNWSIMTPEGDLIGFISLTVGKSLPEQIVIRDRVYKKDKKFI